jgi:GNAT superfamily N-acetyltransferase
MGTDLSIELFASPDVLDPADLSAVTAVFNEAWAGWVPGERPISEVAFADADRFTHAPEVELRYLARDASGMPVGLGWVIWREDEPGGAISRVMVASAATRAGVGTALVRQTIDAARAAGRTGLTLEAAVDSDADRLCEKGGMRADITLELNRTDPRQVPTALLDDWIATGEAADGYSLVGYDGRCPDDDLAAQFIGARHVMNDAPRYEGEPEATYTLTELRAAEAACAAAHQDWWALGVRHDASGELVGLTDLFLPVARPWMAFQGDTGVAPAHRGHRLGAWMKAVNHRRLHAERPDVEMVQTWNASQNAPMLAINRALGFHPVQRFRAWYLPFDG